MKIASMGIDIGKTTFHLVALDEHGSVVIRRKFSRKALLSYGAKPWISLASRRLLAAQSSSPVSSIHS